MEQTKYSVLQNNDNTDYARNNISESRWSYCWHVFTENFIKFFFINILTLLFCIPSAICLVLDNIQIMALVSVYPFGTNLGIGYPIAPNITGMYEQLVFLTDFRYFGFLVISGLLASVGLSGAAYSVRKLINTNGEFTLKSYFHGIKVCYLSMVLPVTIFLIALFGVKTYWNWADLQMAYGKASGGLITGKVFTIIAAVLLGMYVMWLIAVGTSFRLSIGQWFKHSAMLLITLIPHTVIFLGLAFIPLWLYLMGGLFSTLALIFTFMFGFSCVFLFWLGFTQGIFDTLVTPNVKFDEPPKPVKVQKTPEEIAEENKLIATQLLAEGRSELIGTPIKPISDDISLIPELFTRADLERVNADKKNLQSSLQTYVEEHKNEASYAEYNKLFEEREKVIKPAKKGKKKKIDRNNLLGGE